MSRQVITARIERDGATYRILSCGHEQLQAQGGTADASLSAHCRICSATEARTGIAIQPRVKPVDQRNELQRLADAVEAVYVFPCGRAWGRGDVAVRKLIDAARAHGCGGET